MVQPPAVASRREFFAAEAWRASARSLRCVSGRAPMYASFASCVNSTRLRFVRTLGGALSCATATSSLPEAHRNAVGSAFSSEPAVVAAIPLRQRSARAPIGVSFAGSVAPGALALRARCCRCALPRCGGVLADRGSRCGCRAGSPLRTDGGSEPLPGRWWLPYRARMNRCLGPNQAVNRTRRHAASTWRASVGAPVTSAR